MVSLQLLHDRNITWYSAPQHSSLDCLQAGKDSWNGVDLPVQVPRYHHSHEPTSLPRSSRIVWFITGTNLRGILAPGDVFVLKNVLTPRKSSVFIKNSALNDNWCNFERENLLFAGEGWKFWHLVNVMTVLWSWYVREDTIGQ